MDRREFLRQGLKLLAASGVVKVTKVEAGCDGDDGLSLTDRVKWLMRAVDELETRDSENVERIARLEGLIREEHPEWYKEEVI